MSSNAALIVEYHIKGPTGQRHSVQVSWEEGISQGSQEVDIDGRKLKLAFEGIEAEDINLPPGVRTYKAWVPTIDDVHMFTSGRHVDVEVWIPLPGKPGWSGLVKLVQPTATRIHPEGRECRECRVFDQDTGRDIFTRQTHQYVNGSLSQLEWQIHAEAETRGAAPLTENNVGWCWRTKSLVARNSPACVEHFMEKP